MNAKDVLGLIVYLIALINPISKIFILSVLSEQADHKSLRRLAFHSSIVALAILISFALVGKFILLSIFHVDIYSFQVVGGIVLFFIGYKALSRGVFFELQDKNKLEEVSIVPLASPMIAGPATITAVLSYSLSPDHGAVVTIIAVTCAVSVNLLVMFVSEPIGKFLTKFNLMGALIRITGLIVATIATQMFLDGMKSWIAHL